MCHYGNSWCRNQSDTSHECQPKPAEKIATTTPQALSEERLAEILAFKPHWRRDYDEHNRADDAIGDLLIEVRRLKQREANLDTASNLWEGLYNDLFNRPLGKRSSPSWLAQEPDDDNGDYARGVRVP